MTTEARTGVATYVLHPPLRPVWTALVLWAALVGPGFGREPVAVVFLPPQGTTALDDKTAAAAGLLCDQLAGELARDAGLRVVDRTQIDRVLAERALGGGGGPALAYDALVRVIVDPLRAEPAVTLSVVDLSSGNVAGSREWPWTPEAPPGRLREMAGACREFATKAASRAQGCVKLRLLGVAAPGGMGRLEPMRKHLEEVVEQVAGRCSAVCVVRHLEALTAKEESLLVLLGHARLGGGRQFAPHADLVLESEIAETESRGKTFEETSIEIRFRLNRGEDEGAWKSVRGKAGDWPKLAPRLCELLAGELGQASPQTAAQFASEMLVRRSQAEAELQAAMNQKGEHGKPDLARVAAAVKLDPTYEPAAYWLVESCHWQGGGQDTIREALRYLERFPQQPKNRRRVTELAYYAVRQKAPRPQQTEMLRRIVDIGMGGDIQGYDFYCGWMVKEVYEEMRSDGVEESWRTRWLDQVRSRVEALTAQIGRVDSLYRSNVESSLLEMRALLVTIAVDSGDYARARQRLREFMACRRSVARDSWGIAKKLRETVARMPDDQMPREYDRWLAELATPVRQIELVWNDYPVYEKARVALEPARFPSMLPIAAGPAAVCFVSGADGPLELAGRIDKQPARHVLIHIPLDAEGRPTDDGGLPAMPALDKDFAVTGATFLAGNLYVSTKRTGLLACDMRAGKWRQIGPAQGLADWYVYFVHPLDEKTLLLVTGQPDEFRVVYSTMDVKTGRITLVHRTGGEAPSFTAPTRVWWHGGRLMAMNYIGLAPDVLKERPKFKPWPDVWPHGWRCRPNTFSNQPTSIAAVGERRYVMASTGLHQIDGDGRVLRSWWNRKFFYAGGRDHDNLARDAITTPGDFPGDDVDTQYRFVTHSKDHLLLVGSNGEVLCYEPASDTWFGPVRLPAVGRDACAMGTAVGAWIGGSRGTVHVRTTEIIAAAKDAERIMTSPQVRKRKRKLAEQAGPLAAATFDLLLRDFDGARKRVEAILDANPKDPQAILLMAVLHDFWCLNRPEEALSWYDKLSAMEADPSAVYTGLYARFRINYTLGRWEQAIAAGELLLERIPCLYAGMTSEVERFMEYARKQRDKTARGNGR